MQFLSTSIPDVILIRPDVLSDSRGYFLETWEERKFSGLGNGVKFVQDNHSRSTQYVLRGLHYQTPKSQGKLVRVVTGAVFDVAVDLRRSSPFFGRWVGATLSEENHDMLWIPPGFAHGFLVLSQTADFVYRCTDFWVPSGERSVIWDDPVLDVKWPLPLGIRPVLSAKDAAGALFRDAECFP
jgi:dTDP-4-dehydrorhamnose 3,5-epimerase